MVQPLQGVATPGSTELITHSDAIATKEHSFFIGEIAKHFFNSV